MLHITVIRAYAVATLFAAVVLPTCKNEVALNASMSVVITDGIVPCVTLDGRYKVSTLFTDTPVKEYVLWPAKKSDVYGNIAIFKANGSFSSAYGADCGNDCFTATAGRYAWKDENHVRLMVDSINVTGDCARRNDVPHKDLGLYFIVNENDKIRLIKSSGNAKEDKQKLAWSDAIDAFDRETSNVYNFHPIHMLPGKPTDTDAETVERALANNNTFNTDEIKVLYSTKIRSYFKAVLFEYKGKQHIVVSVLHSGYAGLYEPEKWPKK